jgi:hypothetical protein
LLENLDQTICKSVAINHQYIFDQEIRRSHSFSRARNIELQGAVQAYLKWMQSDWLLGSSMCTNLEFCHAPLQAFGGKSTRVETRVAAQRLRDAGVAGFYAISNTWCNRETQGTQNSSRSAWGREMNRAGRLGPPGGGRPVSPRDRARVPEGKRGADKDDAANRRNPAGGRKSGGSAATNRSAGVSNGGSS